MVGGGECRRMTAGEKMINQGPGKNSYKMWKGKEKICIKNKAKTHLYFNICGLSFAMFSLGKIKSQVGEGVWIQEQNIYP